MTEAVEGANGDGNPCRDQADVVDHGEGPNSGEPGVLGGVPFRPV